MMPWRPWKWWRLYKGLGDHDPTTLVFAFAIYALLYGTALIMPGDSFEVSPVYSLARELGVPEVPTGLGMLANGVALLVCLGWRLTATVRSLIAVGTGMGWLFWGGLLVGGGWRVGYFSPGGAWLMLASLIVMQATSGWIYPTTVLVRGEQDPWN
jgi:hypothetical protein